ncbi:LuxR C-terminal-related transcriptional regulator [Gilvimarinus sp. 1_MG-2023]|uniref:LuxR C-terminal-related transcriptional regulator n=1 Tax=Gilvimarinus sp. 1_MG-2023 TaxID=3062638 RepID=UPI0026E4669B|nr:LuxR C-terminal-related transcriptional regulator [Gilvimarinus sp. 1_MG-2023]MDO6745613.1 LuxR C-terminal-related transcriptional regulator [Gilvimarinus sp. 1_MG-2023]
MNLSNAEVRQVAELIRNPPHQTFFTLQAYMQLLCRVLNADAVGWLAAFGGRFGRRDDRERELLTDWKVIDMIFLGMQPAEAQMAKREYLSLSDLLDEVDPLTQWALGTTGCDRVHTMQCSLLSRDDVDHWFPEFFLHKNNIQDRMLGVISLGPNCESYMIIDRNRGSANFSEADQQRLLSFNALMARLHFWLMLERGLTQCANGVLTPRQRQIVHLLLQGLPEQAIAKQLKLKSTTVHNYIIDLYKLYRVNSRSDLLLKWLNTPYLTR